MTDLKALERHIINLREETDDFRAELDQLTDEQIEAEIRRQKDLLADIEWKITGFEAEQSLRELKAILAAPRASLRWGE